MVIERYKIAVEDARKTILILNPKGRMKNLIYLLRLYVLHKRQTKSFLHTFWWFDLNLAELITFDLIIIKQSLRTGHPQ